MALCGANIVRASEIKEEKLTYRVMYKWGLINKQAGLATLSTHDLSDGQFKSTLVGRSATWADKFYTVRDTLMGTIMTDGLYPVYYEKIAHEGGEFKKDIIQYTHNGNKVKGDCTRYRQKKSNQPIVKSSISLEGTHVTLDMLSSFYYMRHLDYPSMKPDQSVSMDIFSGQKKETLKITYIGREDVDVDDTVYPCYYIKFSFTSGNGKKSSDDLFAWISTEPHRIPVMLLGKLPIGSIRCYYVP